MGHMGNGAHGAIVYRRYGVQGVYAMGPICNGGTGGMGHMGNRGTGGMGYKGYGQWVQGYGQWGHRGYGVQGVWATWAMVHMGNGVLGVWGIWAMRPTGGIGYRGMGHMGNRGTGVWGTRGVGNGVQGYRTHGQWGPWAICSQNIKKMSSCQKNVKCQKIKHLDYGGGSQKN